MAVWQGTEIPVIDKPEFYFAFDEFRRDNNVMLFVHLTVRKWCPSVFKEILATFRLFRQYVTCPLYAVGKYDDAKWAKFVSRLGFQFHSNVICENGAERRLFVHQLENNNERKISGNKTKYGDYNQ